ncbi:hypothetical protein NQ314_016524 [Rhamnusium bicolor]|uniref:Uncharacterized protein n=1 Tax=Rhamnusium bicolor TaxID=1586634 RepID=A0AAV8WYB8_9CUCU|nr:hypothetical protein NQ314_016524 [Rhamnusium bicolor]
MRYTKSIMIYMTTTRMLSVTPKVRTKLIKFRYGSSRGQQASHAQEFPGKQVLASSSVQSGEAIWDFQIPPRWRRRPLDEDEIAVINNGVLCKVKVILWVDLL